MFCKFGFWEEIFEIVGCERALTGGNADDTPAETCTPDEGILLWMLCDRIC